jgi:hypothetical protein
MMINPYLEYHEVYGGRADDRVERRGGTGGSSVCPRDSVNLIDELRVALIPPRRRVAFLLGGAMSSSMLRGDWEPSASSKRLSMMAWTMMIPSS